MMNDPKVGLQVSLRLSLAQLLTERAAASDGAESRSSLTEHYIRLGMAAEAAGWTPPEQPAQAQGGAQ